MTGWRFVARASRVGLATKAAGVPSGDRTGSKGKVDLSRVVCANIVDKLNSAAAPEGQIYASQGHDVVVLHT